MAMIEHEITINAPAEKIYKALSSLDGLRSWHTAVIEGEHKLNHNLTLKGKDKPIFVWKVTDLDPNHRLEWECVQGPGDSVGTKVAYSISKTKDGRALVECSHTDWPHTQGNYKKCNTLWGILLHHLKNYVETDVSMPAF
ncbi:SRPBCC family protein [Legionella dresdenensis]|uniref:SRPBCC family protein n=1 Tax=Legionella dresdenensis TaxID=450200 RepID=A0ABV8CCT6_9GAMM